MQAKCKKYDLDGNVCIWFGAFSAYFVNFCAEMAWKTASTGRKTGCVFMILRSPCRRKMQALQKNLQARRKILQALQIFVRCMGRFLTKCQQKERCMYAWRGGEYALLHLL